MGTYYQSSLGTTFKIMYFLQTQQGLIRPLTVNVGNTHSIIGRPPVPFRISNIWSSRDSGSSLDVIVRAITGTVFRGPLSKNNYWRVSRDLSNKDSSARMPKVVGSYTAGGTSMQSTHRQRQHGLHRRSGNILALLRSAAQESSLMHRGTSFRPGLRDYSNAHKPPTKVSDSKEASKTTGSQHRERQDRPEQLSIQGRASPAAGSAVTPSKAYVQKADGIAPAKSPSTISRSNYDMNPKLQTLPTHVPLPDDWAYGIGGKPTIRSGFIVFVYMMLVGWMIGYMR